jgi:hypothetical protein
MHTCARTNAIKRFKKKREDERPDPNWIRGTCLGFAHVLEGHPLLAEQPVEPEPSKQPVNNRANNHRRVATENSVRIINQHPCGTLIADLVDALYLVGKHIGV